MSSSSANRIKPEDFSDYLFWDIDRTTLDLDSKVRYVIGRVVTHGMLKDWNLIKTYYGLERIKNEMLQERYLDKRSLSFLSCIFELPKEQFRCYTTQQSTPTHWDF